jgi:hypothetical protein
MSSFFCRIGLHYYGTLWSNIAPVAGGGPRFVVERCRRCFHERKVRNLQ